MKNGFIILMTRNYKDGISKVIFRENMITYKAISINIAVIFIISSK